MVKFTHSRNRVTLPGRGEIIEILMLVFVYLIVVLSLSSLFDELSQIITYRYQTLKVEMGVLYFMYYRGPKELCSNYKDPPRRRPCSKRG